MKFNSIPTGTKLFCNIMLELVSVSDTNTTSTLMVYYREVEACIPFIPFTTNISHSMLSTLKYCLLIMYQLVNTFFFFFFFGFGLACLNNTVTQSVMQFVNWSENTCCNLGEMLSNLYSMCRKKDVVHSRYYQHSNGLIY